MKRVLLAFAMIMLTACPASAQTVAAARFRFNTGPCMMRSGSGSPEGVVVGNVCDQWHRTDSPYLVYIKRSGSGNTGWLLLASTDLTDTANLPRLNAALNAFASAITIGTTLGVTGRLTTSDWIQVNTSTAGTGLTLTASVAQYPAVQFANVTTGLLGELLFPAAGGFVIRRQHTSLLDYLTFSFGGAATFADTISGTTISATSLGVNALTGALTVGGTSTLTGLANLNGGIAVDTSNFTVNGTTGAVSTASTLDVTGVSTLTGALAANGGITVDATNFTVSGTTGAIATTAVAALTTAAESWVGPATTTGVYFKTSNVGLGTITPVSKLDISDPLTWLSLRDTSALAAGQGGQMIFDAIGTAGGAYGNNAAIMGLRENATDGNYAGYFAFYTNVGTVPGSIGEKMRISSAGHVGIGVTPTRRLHVLNSTLNQLIMAQTTPPTCGTNCGSGSPVVAGSDTHMTLTLGTTPASGFVITFSGAWPTAPSCVGAMATAGMVVGKLPLTIVTTTTTMTVVTNGTAPSTGNKYHFQCGGW